ncbi:MAG: NAD(P)H-dependent oxidoreductase [Pseudomonadota bacterium]
MLSPAKPSAPKRVFVLNGHPAETSLSRSLAEAYADSARAAGHEVRVTHLHDLSFDPDYEFGGYKTQKPLEPQLETVLQDIEWSEHVVVTTPMWWGGLPAKLKGLFDRTLLPGRAFDTRTTTAMGLPAPMLTGRTGRVFMTSDTPGWIMGLFYRSAMLRQVRDQILGFVGITSQVTHFSGATHPKPGMVEAWIARVQQFGAKAA